MKAPPTLSPFLRAAQRKHGDPEAIFQTAVAEPLGAKELARLVSDLRETHPKWKLPKGDRDTLIDALLAAGVGHTRIADRLGCHPRTVARRTAEAARPTPLHRINKRCEPDKKDRSGESHADPRFWTFDASSGADLTRDRQRQLLRLLGFKR